MRVVIGEDDVLLRSGLASLLRDAGVEVVGVAGDGARTAELAIELAPDLAVVDIRMPPTQTSEGLDAARRIRQERPDVGILLLSAHVEVDLAMELVGSGRGTGYLLKSRVSRVEEFLDAVDRIGHGGSVIDPELVRELVQINRRDDPLRRLSQRENEVLVQMAQGRSNAGIARALWIAEATVEKHVRSIMLKLDLDTSDDDHRRVLAVLRYLDTV
jgi:DNA-binding NarL/FixJ family response regulator